MYFVFFFLFPPLHMAILKEGAATVAKLNPAVVAHLSISLNFKLKFFL